MLRLLHGTNYDFIRYWKHAVGITVAFVAAGFLMLALHGGYNYSVEFTGGTLVQVQFANPPGIAAVREAVSAAGFPGAGVTEFGGPNEYAIRAQSASGGQAADTATVDETAKRIEAGLRARFGNDTTALKVIREEYIGPRVGNELKGQALKAILLSFVVTLIYLAIRFEWRFGLACILATSHDILATLAFIAMLDLEVSLTVVAAILSVIGFSLNDTIVIFDRVRENLHKQRKESLREVLNRSINETLPRSILTNVTTLAASLALLIFAGEIIRPFAWVMAFGIFTGTFSSIYVGGALLLWIEHKWPRPTSVDPRPTSRQGAAPEAKTARQRPVGASAR
jgi:preprotein translocase subunit SecF